LTDVKVTKKDIQEAKKPDAVLEGATSVFDWLYEKRMLAGGVLVALLVVVGVASVVTAQSRTKKHDTGAKLSEAVELESRPVVEKKAEAPATETASDTKSFPSKAEKAKAVEAALTAIVKDHPGSGAARAAELQLAHAQYEAGKYDDAIQGYETYLKEGDEGDLRLFALEGLGYAYEAKGDAVKAGEAFAKLADAGAPGRALFHKARMLEKQGKKDEAKKAYEDVIATYEKDIVAGDARARLELLSLPPAGTGTIEAPAAPVEPAKDLKKPAKAPKKPAIK
jgi:TolA-binding protein